MLLKSAAENVQDEKNQMDVSSVHESDSPKESCPVGGRTNNGDVWFEEVGTKAEESDRSGKSWNQFSNLLHNIEDIINNIDIKDNCVESAGACASGRPDGTEEENANNCLEIHAADNLHSYESCYSSMSAINKLLQPSYNPILTYQCRNPMKELHDSDLRSSLKIVANRAVIPEESLDLEDGRSSFHNSLECSVDDAINDLELSDDLSEDSQRTLVAAQRDSDDLQCCRSESPKSKLDLLNNTLINDNEIIKNVLSATSSLDFINDDLADIFKEDESISSDENSFIMNELSILNEDADSKASLPSSSDTSSIVAEDVSFQEAESIGSSIFSSESFDNNPLNGSCSYSWVYEGNDDVRFEPDFSETEHMLLSLNTNSSCSHFVKSKLNTILECDEHNSVDSDTAMSSIQTDTRGDDSADEIIDYTSELPHPSTLDKYFCQEAGDVKLTSFSSTDPSTPFPNCEEDRRWRGDVKVSVLNKKNALSKLRPVNPIVLKDAKLSGFPNVKRAAPPAYFTGMNKLATDDSERKLGQTDREECEIDVANNCIPVEKSDDEVEQGSSATSDDFEPGEDEVDRVAEEVMHGSGPEAIVEIGGDEDMVKRSINEVTGGSINVDKQVQNENCENLTELKSNREMCVTGRAFKSSANEISFKVFANEVLSQNNFDVSHDVDDSKSVWGEHKVTDWKMENDNQLRKLKSSSEETRINSENDVTNVNADGAFMKNGSEYHSSDNEENVENKANGCSSEPVSIPGNELYSLSDIDYVIDQMESAARGRCGFYSVSGAQLREYQTANMDSNSFLDEDSETSSSDLDAKRCESTTVSEFGDSVSEFENFMLFDPESKTVSECNTSAISEFTDSAISEFDSTYDQSFPHFPHVSSDIITTCPETKRSKFSSPNRFDPRKVELKNLPDLCQTCPYTRTVSDENLTDLSIFDAKKSKDLADCVTFDDLNVEKDARAFNDDFSDSDHGIELADFESRSSCSPDYSVSQDSKLHANQKINQNFYENLLINLDKFKSFSIKDKITYYELKNNQNYSRIDSDQKFNILKTFGDLKSTKSNTERRKVPRTEKSVVAAQRRLLESQCRSDGGSKCVRGCENRNENFNYLTKSELKSLRLSHNENSFRNTREKSKSFSDITGSEDLNFGRENLAFSVHLGFNKGQQYASECQIFFRSGVLAQLELQRDAKLTDRIIKLQSHCRGYLARKKLAKLKVEDLAVRCIQRNVRKFMSVRDWAWWRLLVRVTPLLNVHRTEEELKSKTEELESLRAKLDKLEQERNLLKHETDKLETKLSEMTVDLAEEHSTATVASERLEIETSERLRLEKELQEIQIKNKRLQENGERLELEVLHLHSADVNGSALHSEDDDDESGDRTGVYKRRYERVARELEFAKRRLDQQHQDDLEQLIGLRKQLEKKLADAYEEVEEQRQVVAQWKRKVQKLNSELNDVRLLLEEQNSRNILLEKKQRKFDAELQMLQDELRQERQQKERSSREREIAVSEKYSMEQTLSAVKLELELKEQKLVNLNRELEELMFNGSTEEEVANLKKSKHQLDNKIKDQEEELDDLAGQVQMLEQAKLKLEMSLEQMRKEHRRELMQKDDEIEDARCSAVKKVKALECQLESEHEERTLLLRERHELERRLNDLEDRERVNRTSDQEQLNRLRRDLKRTKALLQDAQIMLQQAKADTPNKTILRQLRNQLEDAECARNLAIKARQTAEADLLEVQLALEEATRAKNEAEEKSAVISRERSQLQTQLDENEEELAEVLKKYRATVQQLSSEQSQLREQVGKIVELETERQSLKEQLNEMTSRLENVGSMNDPVSSLTVKRLELKCKELESKLELEQTTRSRMEVQISRLKETVERLQSDTDIAKGREAAAQDLVRKLQRNIRDLKEQLSQHESRENSETVKRKELEKRLEESEAETSAAKTDLRLALQRIEDLQLAIQGELDQDDEDDDSATDSDNSASSDESFESFLTNHNSGSADRSSVIRSNFSRSEEVSPLKITNSSASAKESSSPPSSFA
nr:PREDICTED: centrosomal protein of 290 kDa isoform X3 [Bemisia tabaci]